MLIFSLGHPLNNSRHHSKYMPDDKSGYILTKRLHDVKGIFG